MRKLISMIAVSCVVAACGDSNSGEGDSSSGSPSSSPNSSSVSSSASSSHSSAPIVTGCASGSLLCADFEGSDSLPTGWSASDENTVVVSSDEAYSGTNSLKVTGKGGGYNQNLLAYDLTAVPELSEAMYGRMMVHLSGENSRGGDFTFIQADGSPRAESGAPEDTSVMYRGRLDGRNDHFMANYDTWLDNGSGQTAWLTDCWAHPNNPPPQEYLIPKDEWACVQWHFDAELNTMKFWLNDNELAQIQVVNSGDGCVAPGTQNNVWWGPKSFNSVQLGIEQYHNDSRPRVMYIDDIAIDDRVVSCPD